jgi:hypothetical protein
MSELKVNKISPRSGTDVTLGDSGDTFTVPAGASIVNNGTATGFGATGAVNWDTTAKTANFNAVSKVGYFVDTTSGEITVTLPATPSAGDIVGLVDYAGTFDTNQLIIDPNGEDIEGGTADLVLRGEREGVVLLYVDSTQGWLAISGINEGTDALEPNTYSIDFLVIAGGGGGGSNSGGGGAGGYRTSTQSITPGTAITVTVGDGGAGGLYSAGAYTNGASGSNSSISGTGLTTITSAGGGGGAGNGKDGVNGGSGGGGGNSGASQTGGSGNTPITSPSQGNNGGSSSGSPYGGGGGGGASAVGANKGGTGGAGGAGTASSITGSSVTRAGGGGGGGNGIPAAAGGAGGGGDGVNGSTGDAGDVNTGGGGGGASENPPADGGAGGKGVVILAMPLAKFSGTVTGSPTESDDGTTKRLVFNGDGSYTT